MLQNFLEKVLLPALECLKVDCNGKSSVFSTLLCCSTQKQLFIIVNNQVIKV